MLNRLFAGLPVLAAWMLVSWAEAAENGAAAIAEKVGLTRGICVVARRPRLRRGKGTSSRRRRDGSSSNSPATTTSARRRRRPTRPASTASRSRGQGPPARIGLCRPSGRRRGRVGRRAGALPRPRFCGCSARGKGTGWRGSLEQCPSPRAWTIEPSLPQSRQQPLLAGPAGAGAAPDAVRRRAAFGPGPQAVVASAGAGLHRHGERRLAPARRTVMTRCWPSTASTARRSGSGR